MLFISLLLLAGVSCVKESPDAPIGGWGVKGQSAEAGDGEEVVLSVGFLRDVGTKALTDGRTAHYYTDGMLDYEIIEEPYGEELDAPETKTTAITSLSGTWYWGATTGGNSAGTAAERAKFAKTAGTVSSNTISTGRYQTATPTAYNWYVTNCPNMYVNAASYITVPNNSTDYIAGRAYASTSATPSVTLEHVFCRTGTFTFNSSNGYGYTFSNIAWAIQGRGSLAGTAGTYSLRSGSWTACSTPLTLTVLGSNTASVTTDLYLIPSTYTLFLNFRVTNGTTHLDVSRECELNFSTKGRRFSVNVTTSMTFSWDDGWDDGYDPGGDINL